MPSHATQNQTKAAKNRNAEFEAQALVHLDALYGTALRLTRQPSRAEDLVQEALLRGFQNWDQFADGTNCRAWLFRILTNTFINGYRRKTKEREILDKEQVGAYGDRFFCRDAARAWACPETGYNSRNLSAPVAAALSSLQPDFRMVVELSDLQGFAYREIAEMIDCPIGTVMSRLFRARRALRTKLRVQAEAYGIATAA
ncbi:MAG: RNA polymerase sigma-70 factor (ECF subfamily) [Myxococcota bacterium]|jgi:RNA polymerase sigma-70 factor (ECF subfamily)